MSNPKSFSKAIDSISSLPSGDTAHRPSAALPKQTPQSPRKFPAKIRTRAPCIFSCLRRPIITTNITVYCVSRNRASQSHCPLHHKPESQRHVNGWKTLRSRLRCRLRLAQRTTGDWMATHRRLDWRRVYLWAGKSRKRASLIASALDNQSQSVRKTLPVRWPAFLSDHRLNSDV